MFRTHSKLRYGDDTVEILGMMASKLATVYFYKPYSIRSLEHGLELELILF